MLNEKRRIICSLKQLKENPWNLLTKKYNLNDIFETEIVNVVDFGVFVKVHEEIDGMIHISDLSWNEDECSKKLSEYKKGDSVKVKILDIGCGNPSFLEACKKSLKCNTMGIDFSDEGWKNELLRFKEITLQVAEIKDLGANIRPDVITMWHYLEHDYKPFENF